MKISYVTMQFPAPSETFAGVEVRALLGAGSDVSIHSLRFPLPHWKALLESWGLSDADVNQVAWGDLLRGVGRCLASPLQTWSLLLWVIGKTYSTPREMLKSLALIPLVVNLFAKLRQDRPDVVHLFWGHYPSMLGYLLQRHCPEIVLSIFLGAYDLRLNYGCSPEVAEHADAVWTHTRYNLSQIEQYGVDSDKLRVSYRGIDLQLLQQDAPPDKITRRIVSAGRLNQWKRMDWVIRVFHALHQEWPDTSLVILGEGAEMASLQQLAEDLGVRDSVEFRGYVPHSQVYREMSQAELFLFFSKDERLPNVVKEAMACRCLCLVTKTPGIEELITSGENGFVLPDDLNSIIAVAKRILRHDYPETQILDSAMQTIQSLFDAHRNVENYLQVWEGLVQSKRCP